MADNAAARYLQQRQKERAAIRARVAEAKATSTQEKFDFRTFASLYDVRRDYGSAPITPEVSDRYEEEYYLGPIQASTIREFAARKEELKLDDAT
jgi:hypothetical protein